MEIETSGFQPLDSNGFKAMTDTTLPYLTTSVPNMSPVSPSFYACSTGIPLRWSLRAGVLHGFLDASSLLHPAHPTPVSLNETNTFPRISSNYFEGSPPSLNYEPIMMEVERVAVQPPNVPVTVNSPLPRTYFSEIQREEEECSANLFEDICEESAYVWRNFWSSDLWCNETDVWWTDYMDEEENWEDV